MIEKLNSELNGIVKNMQEGTNITAEIELNTLKSGIEKLVEKWGKRKDKELDWKYHLNNIRAEEISQCIQDLKQLLEEK